MSRKKPLLRRQDQTCKVFEATVVCAFRILRETAGWQLALREVIREAIAADTLFGTTVVGAIATGKICFLFTVHVSNTFTGMVEYWKVGVYRQWRDALRRVRRPRPAFAKATAWQAERGPPAGALSHGRNGGCPPTGFNHPVEVMGHLKWRLFSLK
jgi:hypothetical protein